MHSSQRTPVLSPNLANLFSSDEASSNLLDSCLVCPSPEEERPPPPYPFPVSSSSSFSSSSSLFSVSHLRVRPECVPPSAFSRWSVYSPPPPPLLSSTSLDINSNPKPSVLHLSKQGSLPTEPSPPHAPVYIKPPLAPCLSTLSPHSAAPLWAACSRERGLRVPR
ncbi:uncharacterized protein LOC132121747 [Carassius carassius]|uniref:uncharacterized protein LOC132121747 n=1 Tax=Carassius carassius TaxID=217509 RepID=UPI0028693F25|nr:uncharacterized protein LOC132121747 [Carassius carassius]